MKKKILAVTGALALVGTLGVGIYQSDASQVTPELNQDEVISLISSQYPGTITEFELDKEDNRLVYEIEIENDGVEYELELDANSGEIIKSEEERKSSSKTVKESTTKDQSKIQSAEKSKHGIIDMNEAIEIASTEFSGVVEEVELDKDDGQLIYEIEIEANDKEAEFEIDARTGEIIDMEIDD